MKTKTWKKMISSVFIVLICLQIGFADDVRLKIPESTVNNILAAIVESKYLSYGTSCNIDISFLSLNVAVVTYYSFKPQDISLDISTGNNFSLTIDFKIKANFDTPIFDFLLKASNLSVTINGTIDRVEQGSGYKIRLTPLSLYYNNNDWVNIVLHDQLSGLIAKLPEISTSSSQPLLPNIVASYFTSGTPTLTTTDTSIVLGLTMVAGLRNIKVQNEVNQLNTLGNVQTVVNGSVTGTYPSPKTFEWNTGNVKQVQTPNELIASTNGQNKYKNWYKDDATLPETDIATRRIEITVASSDATYTAKFLQAQRVQLSNVLEGSLTGGTVTYESTTGSMYDSYEYCYNANPVPHSISTNVPSGTLNSDWVFYHWSDGNTSQTRNIVVDSDKNLQANWKGIHRSNDAAAFNTSQRKLIQTLAGGNPRWLHQVYTSAGHVWLEHSGDGGSTWTLGNNGQPLDGTAGGKCPSIAYTTHYTGSTTDNYIGVVWQEKDGTHYKIKGKIFNQYGDVNSAPSPYYEVTTLFTEPSDAYDAVNANPNLVMYVGYASPYFLTFERKSTSGSLEPGINWLGGYTEDSGHRYLGPFGLPDDQGLLNGTNASTTNVQLSIVPSDLDFCINLVRQAGPTGAIYGQFLYLQPDYSDWFIYQENPVMISYPTANLCPSIVSLPNYYYNACWIEVQNMVFYNAESSVRYYYGTYGTSCSINRGGGGSSSGFAVWSQQPSSGGTKSNKSIRYDNGTPISSSIQTLSTTGKYVQVGNGATSNHSYMYVSSFYPNSVPYYFSTSQTLGPLSKSSSELVEGRGFIIKKGDVYFKYNLEGLNVDGQDIAFIDASDEVDYSKIDNLNNVLLTEPFQLKEDSKVVFMEESGFADSILSSKALGKEGYIHYKVELIDEATGKIVGTIKNVNLNASNVHTTQKPTYSLNTKGLDSKIVRAKITLETNFVDENSGKPTTTAQDLSHIPPAIREKRLNIKNPNIILTKSYSEENVSLAKAIFEQLELEKPDIPISYSLEQNYPNPFNPATTIHYELPKAGNVTINVYNLLGEEVATLVKGEKQEGRYSVTFDGSLLSSGTYLVRMQSGNYSKTIKILLIK